MTPTTIEVKPINTNSANEIALQANDLTKQVNTLTIKNQESYEGAAELLRTVKALSKKLEDTRKSITSPLDLAKKAVLDLFRAPSDVLETAEKKIKTSMISYSNEQERIRQEAESKLRREAEEKARKERERLEARAQKAEESGKDSKADDLREQAAQVQAVAPVLATTVEKPQGIIMKKNWKARIIDEKLIPRQFLCVDEKKLDQIAKATKGSMEVPGVQFYSEDILASR